MKGHEQETGIEKVGLSPTASILLMGLVAGGLESTSNRVTGGGA